MDSISGSVTQHIVALKAGDEAAVQLEKANVSG
jgi:hypothetical protein